MSVDWLDEVEDVKLSSFQCFDLIGFSSWSRLGVAINLFSLGVPLYHLSHIAVVARHPKVNKLLLCESTTQYRRPCFIQGRVVDGVQWHEIGPRIRSYRGLVYRYRLREPLTPEQEGKLSEFLAGMTGRGYDALGALGARDTLLGALVRIGKKEDLTSLFCSELCISAGEAIEVFPKKCNASGFSPNRSVRKAVCCWRTHHRPDWVKRLPCPG